MRQLVSGKPEAVFYNHIGARRVRQLVKPSIWNQYLIFAFDRNPWDKVVSEYFWRYRKELQANGPKPIAFVEFARRSKRFLDVSGFDKYAISGEVVADFVGRYERLQEDLGEITARLGITWDGWLPKAKTSTPRSTRRYQELYDQVSRDRIAKLYAREIDLLGYTFD